MLSMKNVTIRSMIFLVFESVLMLYIFAFFSTVLIVLSVVVVGTLSAMYQQRFSLIFC